MSDHLKIEGPLFADRPHGWIQWKGTRVCIDLHCECGALLHFDGDFLYYWVCPHCKRMWEMGTHIPMYEIPPDRQAERLANACVVTDIEPDQDLAEGSPRIQKLMNAAVAQRPDACDGHSCIECDPYGCAYPPATVADVR